MKQQVVVLHGGNAFETREKYLAYLSEKEVSLEKMRFVDWKGRLADSLGEGFDVVLPRMPNSLNARYEEWKIVFDKLVPLLDEGVILAGHSLGGIFLAKYLSEEKLSKEIKATLLVAAPYDSTDEEPLLDFSLGNGLSLLQEQGGEVILYHSEDDFVVPFSSMESYKRELPDATIRVFSDRKHFNGEEFPELVEDLRRLASS